MKLPQLERELARHGFALHHIRKHRIYKDMQGRRLVVAAHVGRELDPGHVAAIRRDLRRVLLRDDLAAGACCPPHRDAEEAS